MINSILLNYVQDNHIYICIINNVSLLYQQLLSIMEASMLIEFHLSNLLWLLSENETIIFSDLNVTIKIASFEVELKVIKIFSLIQGSKKGISGWIDLQISVPSTFKLWVDKLLPGLVSKCFVLWNIDTIQNIEFKLIYIGVPSSTMKWLPCGTGTLQ